MNYKIILAYDGRNYKGYAKQPNFNTVQGELENCISTIFNKPIVTYGSGRTDAGVHALGQVVSFSVDNSLYPPEQLKYKLNKMLPNDIVIKNLEETDENFHARYSAKGKEYQYIMAVQKERDVFKQGLVTPINYPLDYGKLDQVISIIKGEHCFKNFTSKEEDNEGFVRNIYEIKRFFDDNGNLVISFNGNGFMTYEIRMLVANIILFAGGRITLNETIDRLNKAERDITPYCFPPDGLYLIEVHY